jgi:hypothetical protein
MTAVQPCKFCGEPVYVKRCRDRTFRPFNPDGSQHAKWLCSSTAKKKETGDAS